MTKTLINKILLSSITLISIAGCHGKKELKYYPNSIPPFLQEEVDIEKVFSPKSATNKKTTETKDNKEDKE